MKTASGALIALLNSSQQLQIADVLTIVPLGAPTLYLTNAQTDITVVSQVDNASHTFKHGGVDQAGTVRPTYVRGQTTSKVGTEVDRSSITLMTNVLALVSGLPWTQQARLGYFDGARVYLERCFSATWGDWSAGTLMPFTGLVSNVQPTRTTLVLNIVSDLVRLQLQTPRNQYQPGCLHNVYDAGCTLARGPFTTAGVVAAGSTTSSVNTNLTQADGYFTLGYITFTSGALNGITRTVRSYANSGGVVVPTATLPVAPSNGDTFSIVPGCDKTQNTCTTKFANLAHFRGFPYVPPPEATA